MIVSSKSGECKICCNEMKFRDQSFTHNHGGTDQIEEDGYYYCDECHSEDDYDNEEIHHTNNIQSPSSNTIYNTYGCKAEFGSIDNIVIVTADNAIISEMEDLGAGNIGALIEFILEKEAK